MSQPITRYVESQGTHIAWQSVGQGPVDLVWVPGFISHLDLQWGDRGFLRIIRRLTRFARVIMLDKAGVGLSDPVSEPRTLEAQVADLLAVMDAADAHHPIILGMSESGPLSVLLAAAHPDRVRALIMFSVIVKGQADDGHPWGVTDEQWEQIRDVVDHWGEGRMLDLMAPSVADSAVQRRVFASVERATVSPGTARAIMHTIRSLDVTSVLPSVSVPTLVLARNREFFDVEQARFIATVVSGARLVELDGIDHMSSVGDIDAWLDPVEEFVTGAAPADRSERAFATMLEVDVVESTRHAVEMGDMRWREVLVSYTDAAHDAITARDGTVVSVAGDGLLACFGGPRAALAAAWDIRRAAVARGLEVRSGIHAGEVELVGEDVAGIEVHVASRIGDVAPAGEVLLSDAAYGLVGSGSGGVEFVDAGSHALKGIPDRHQLWRAIRAASPHADGHRDMRRIDRVLTRVSSISKRVTAAGIR